MAAGASGLGRRGRRSEVRAHPLGYLGLWQEVAVLSGSVTPIHSDDHEEDEAEGDSQQSRKTSSPDGPLNRSSTGF